MRQLNKQERDTARLNIIGKDTWIKHYQELWTEKEDNGIEDESSEHSLNLTMDGAYNETLYTGDEITLNKVQDALKKMKNRKAAGPDNINIELIKYGGIMLELRMPHLMNECWKQRKVPDEWKIAEVISLYKKRKSKLMRKL